MGRGMSQCNCGSRATNIDTEVCDVCFYKNQLIKIKTELQDFCLINSDYHLKELKKIVKSIKINNG